MRCTQQFWTCLPEEDRTTIMQARVTIDQADSAARMRQTRTIACLLYHYLTDAAQRTFLSAVIGW
jgi:hypothetical protein